MFYAALEGVVGAGKSTLLNFFPKVVREPIDLFQKFGAHNPLQRSYEGNAGDKVCAQLHIMEQVVPFYSSSIVSHYDSTNFVISERSVFSPLFFVTAARSLGQYSAFTAEYLEHHLMKKVSGAAELHGSGILPDLYIILSLDSNTALQRIRERSRDEERMCDFLFIDALNAAHKTKKLPTCQGKKSQIVFIESKDSPKNVYAEVVRSVERSLKVRDE